MRDFRPAFCGECEVYLTVMVDQRGDYVLTCSCPGRYDLTGDALAFVEGRVAEDAEP